MVNFSRVPFIYNRTCTEFYVREQFTEMRIKVRNTNTNVHGGHPSRCTLHNATKRNAAQTQHKIVSTKNKLGLTAGSVLAAPLRQAYRVQV